MKGIELLLLFSFFSMGYCYVYLEDGTYNMFLKGEGKITKEKLTTNKNVTFLDIAWAKVTSIEPNSFCAIPNVRTIHLSINEMFPKITKELFQCTPELSAFSIFGSSEANQEIERDAFTDLKDFTYLHIRTVNIGRLGKDMFVGLLDMTILVLRDCNITGIDSDSFSEMPNLMDIDLSHNSIRSIEPGTFKNLPHLRDLILADNEISEINWDQWDILPSLEMIVFADNPIVKYDVSKIKDYFPNIVDFILGGDFNETQKMAIIEEGKRFNISISFMFLYGLHTDDMK